MACFRVHLTSGHLIYKQKIMVPYFPTSLLPLNYNDELRYHFFHYTTNYIGVGNKSKYFMNDDLFQSRHAFSDLLVGV